MRILVTGSRSFSDKEKIARGLDEVTARAPMHKGGIVIIEGGAVGLIRCAASKHGREGGM